MARKETPPTVVIKFINNAPQVHINQFEKITPGMLDKASDAMQTEWNRERGLAITRKKANELKLRREAEAKKAEEKEETENA